VVRGLDRQESARLFTLGRSGSNDGRGFWTALRSGAQHADDCGEQRDKNDGANDVVNALANVRDDGTKRIAAQDHASDPQDAAGHVKRKIAPVRHPGRARYWRAERANDGDKAREDDGFAAVFFVELVGAFQMAPVKEEGIFTPIKGLARFVANPVADLVPHDRAQRDERQQMRQLKMSRGREDSSGDQKGIAGKKKPHEEARLNEDDRADQQRPAPLDQALNVKQEMKKMFERSNHE